MFDVWPYVFEDLVYKNYRMSAIFKIQQEINISADRFAVMFIDQKLESC